MEHTIEDWVQACDLEKKGREWVGPCPLCGGEDRFHVREQGTRVLVGCRGCIDGHHEADRHQRYGELRRAVFGNDSIARGGHWFDEHRSRTPGGAPRLDSTFSHPNSSNTRKAFGRHPAETTNEEQERIALANRLWDAAEAADRTPARAYLAARLAWPPDGIGPPLPSTIRWLPRNKVEKGIRVPIASSGCLVFAFHAQPGSQLRAVSCEALTQGGQRLDKIPDGTRWRRTYGMRRDTAFVVNAGAPNLLIAEGEVDVLAARWLYPDHEAWAVGGTAGLKGWNGAPGDDRPIMIIADGDSAGRSAGEHARASSKATGHSVRVSWCRPPEDLADEFAATLRERIAILETGAEMTHAEAEAHVWQQTLEGA